jgi:hypothetical protein
VHLRGRQKPVIALQGLGIAGALGRWRQDQARLGQPLHLSSEGPVGGEVHDRVVGQEALIGEVLEPPLGGLGAGQDVALGSTQTARDFAQLIGGRIGADR